MFSWLREYYDIQHNRRLQLLQESEGKLGLDEAEQICGSCETLKMQLAIANQQNDKLLSRLLEKPVPEVKVDTSEMLPLKTNSHLSFQARRQMLEANSRAEARALAERTRDLEKELNISTPKVEEGDENEVSAK